MRRAYGPEACVVFVGGGIGRAGAEEEGKGCCEIQWQGAHCGREGPCALYVIRSVSEAMASYGSVRRVV
jgi:hypothetical protein